MNIKKIIIGCAVLGVLLGGTVGINAFAADSADLSTAQKQIENYVSKFKGNISKEDALKIIDNAYNEYFGTSVDSNKFSNIRFIEENSSWCSVYKDTANNKVYFAVLQKDGTIKEIGYEENNKDDDEEIEKAIDKSNSNKEEAIKIAKTFMVEKGLVTDAEDLQFLRVGNMADYDFAYGKDEKTGDNKVVYMNINTENNKVTSVCFASEHSK